MLTRRIIIMRRAAAWYATHVVPAGHRVIVVSTDVATLKLGNKIYARFMDLPAVPDCVSMLGFIKTWCPDSAELLELYSSLAAVVEATVETGIAQRNPSVCTFECVHHLLTVVKFPF